MVDEAGATSPAVIFRLFTRTSLRRPALQVSDPVIKTGAAGQPAMRTDLFGLTFSEFSAWLKSAVGFDDRYHRTLYRQLMQDGRIDASSIPEWQEAATRLPDILTKLAALLGGEQLPSVVTEHTADDPALGTTAKLVLRLADGQQVETVCIPMGGGVQRGGYATVCVSSQVGCRMGCQFCHTATMGLVRHLSAAEIVAQVVMVAVHLGIVPRNVVFMGMGEPLDNLDAVAQVVAVLSDTCGLKLAQRHITISTVGRVDGLQRFAELGLTRINLAVSLSAADNSLRDDLMPVNKRWDLQSLHAALAALPLPKDRRILISYVCMDGVNDSDEAIDRLIAWTQGLPVLVNLIPYNPIPSRPERPTPTPRIEAIRDRLLDADVPVRLRRTKGDAVMAACGQLGDPALGVRR